MATRKLIVEILGDTRNLERAYKRADKSGKAFAASTTRTTKQAQAGVKGLGLGYIGATTAALAFGGAVRASFGELFEAQKVAAQTQAVLKSTGGVANVTAEDVDRLSTSLLNLTGIDDEAIKAGANLLLTFRNIRNELGAGNDIFNQATVAALDMSVAMGTDLNSAVLRIGKALNDPVRGLTALRRVGVQFTKDQEKEIKALVASGRELQAQKIILRELQTEFGGSAKAAGDTLPGQLNKLRESSKNLGATIAGVLVPALLDATKGLGNFLKGVERLNDSPRAGAGAFFDALTSDFSRRAAEATPIIGPFANALGVAFDDAGKKHADIYAKSLGRELRKQIRAQFIELPPINTAGAGGIIQFFRKNLRQPGTATPFLDFQKAQAVAARSLRQQLAIIRQTITVLEGRLGRAGTLKAKTALREEINQLQQEAYGIVRTLNDAKQAAAAARREANRARAERRREQAERRREARETAQFRLLGLGPDGGELAPTFAQVKKSLGKITDAVRGTFLDTGKTRSLLQNIRKILKAGIKGVSDDVLSAIKQLLDDIDAQLKEHGRQRTKFQVVGIDQLVSGLGLTPEQERALRGRLAGRGPGGKSATGPSASAFGTPVKGGPNSVTVNGPVHIHGVQNRAELIKALQKEGQRRSGTRRGPNAGASLGLT